MKKQSSTTLLFIIMLISGGTPNVRILLTTCKLDKEKLLQNGEQLLPIAFALEPVSHCFCTTLQSF